MAPSFARVLLISESRCFGDSSSLLVPGPRSGSPPSRAARPSRVRLRVVQIRGQVRAAVQQGSGHAGRSETSVGQTRTGPVPREVSVGCPDWRGDPSREALSSGSLAAGAALPTRFKVQSGRSRGGRCSSP